MKEEILELILENAQKNVGKELTKQDIERIIEETERELGYELSGYGVKDKPYRQYFSEEVLNTTAKEERIAKTVIDCSQTVRDKIAYRCGKNVTFGELADNIFKYAYVFKQNGIKKDDVVAMYVTSIPDAIYAFFAANLIGAAVKPIDPIATPDSVKRTIEKTNAKTLITLSINYPKLKNIVSETCLDNVVYLSMKNYMPFVPKHKQMLINVMDRVFSKMAKQNESSKWISKKEYLKNVDINNIKLEDIEEPYDPNEVVAFFSTSGSSGVPKDVSTTNQSFLDSIARQKNAEFDITKEDSMFNPMPSSSSYFWYDIVLAAVWKVTTSLSPLFDSEIGHLITLKDVSTVPLTGPIILERMCDYIEMRDLQHKPVDLSGKKYIISGGDLLELELEKRINKLFKEHGTNIIVTNALGTSENTGPAFNPNGILKNKKTYVEGAVGTPFPGNNAAIFAYDEENECSAMNRENFSDGLLYYEIGEICHSCDNLNVFKEYYKDEEATNAVKLQHPDGSWWYHTGDLGYSDPGGRFFCSGRKNGLIVRSGHKVWTPKIVNIVKGIDGVKDCAVIGVSDEKEKEVPACFIVYNENVSEELKKYIITKINLTITKEIDSQHIPLYYEEIKEIPRNLMMKVKIGQLANMFKEKYNSEIETKEQVKSFN